MNRPLFALIFALIVALVFVAMWLGWRARSRRDAGVQGSQQAPTGTLIERFERIFYVSTTPVGEPLTRVAVPGLRYRGRANVEVREDGVTVQVDGEDAVHFAADQLRGSANAARRVGKAVEKNGLALMLWVSGPGDPLAPRTLESSFRFDGKAEERRFTAALDSFAANEAAETEMSVVQGIIDQEPSVTEEGTR